LNSHLFLVNALLWLHAQLVFFLFAFHPIKILQFLFDFSFQSSYVKLGVGFVLLLKSGMISVQFTLDAAVGSDVGHPPKSLNVNKLQRFLEGFFGQIVE